MVGCLFFVYITEKIQACNWKDVRSSAFPKLRTGLRDLTISMAMVAILMSKPDRIAVIATGPKPQSRFYLNGELLLLRPPRLPSPPFRRFVKCFGFPWPVTLASDTKRFLKMMTTSSGSRLRSVAGLVIVKHTRDNRTIYVSSRKTAEGHCRYVKRPAPSDMQVWGNPLPVDPLVSRLAAGGTKDGSACDNDSPH